MENDILNQPDDDVSSTNAPSIGLPDIIEEGGNAEAYTYEHDNFNPSVQLQDIRQEKQSELECCLDTYYLCRLNIHIFQRLLSAGWKGLTIITECEIALS